MLFENSFVLEVELFVFFVRCNYVAYSVKLLCIFCRELMFLLLIYFSLIYLCIYLGVCQCQMKYELSDHSVLFL